MSRPSRQSILGVLLLAVVSIDQHERSYDVRQVLIELMNAITGMYGRTVDADPSVQRVAND